MENSQTTTNPSEPEPIQADEFASGKDNRLRRILPRLMRWLFGPPYFPPILVWPLLAIILTDISSDLLRQKPAFWVDPTISYTRTLLGFPLSWGPLVALAIFAGYMLLVGILLVLINRQVALLAWVTLSLYHLYYIVHDFSCRATPLYAFLDSKSCPHSQAGAVILAGMVFAVNLAAAYSLGLIPLIREQPDRDEQPFSRTSRTLIYASFLWALILITLLGIAAFPAKSDWRKVETVHVPSPRTSAALGYDIQRSRAVLFGGASEWTQQNAWNSLDDTWEWDGNDWIEVFPQNSPSPRRDAGMAYDEARGVMVLFGGIRQIDANKSKFLNDTWEWDGQDWIERTPEFSPPGRGSVNIFFDRLRQKIVMAGGFSVDETSNTVFPKDTWEWDGETWKQVFLDRERSSSAESIIFDPLQETPMVMGGEGLWILKDNRWFQPSYPQAPSGRWGTRMVFDPAHQQVILFGGYKDQDTFFETWGFDGETWNKIMTENHPLVPTGFALFYDANRNSIILFGGFRDMIFFNDTWELKQP